jgi:N-methylhydantoinase A
VTDAHVWLGRLPADAFLGGERRLDRDAVREPLARIARDLGTNVEAAAEGVLAVADTAMERALRVISVERGYDPVDFAVVAFGGAGGLHVAELTGRLGARKAIVPPDPGLLSAYGMLASPITREASRTVLLRSDQAGTEEVLRSVLAELEADAREAMRADGAEPAELTAEHRVDARYRGQSFELEVPDRGWSVAFHRAHLERYGYQRPETPVEAVTLRVIVSAPPPDLVSLQVPEATDPPPSTRVEVFHEGRTVTGRRIRREDLRAGHEVDGPAVVQEYSGTCWVPPSWRLRVDAWGCLHLTAAP